MKKIPYLFLLFSAALFMACESDTASNFTTPPNGQGGSMARFALSDNHLYVVDNYTINVYKINTNGSLAVENTVEIGFGIETITARGQQLFLGATNGMYIYDISTPANPLFVSRYDHIKACDPVVVKDQYAYVTLRIGSTCNAAGSDALEVIDLSDLNNPYLVKSYPLSTPYGLGIDGNALFVCEGANGLKIFNVDKPDSIYEIQHYTGINAYDVIPNKGVLIMTGTDGIFQYDYKNLTDIHLLSQIKIQ